GVHDSGGAGGGTVRQLGAVGDLDEWGAAMSEILFRSAAPEDVRFDRREIDVLAVPYNTPTSVRDYDGTAYLETIAPGAFAEVGLRARRIKVLRDHRPERAIGKCVALDADQVDGLHATLHITPGIPLG